MVPASWRSKPPIIRRSVVFPHPLGPCSETTVPGRMVRAHSLTASTSANRLEMPLRAIAGPSSSTLSSTGAGGAAATFFCVVDKSGRLYTLPFRIPVVKTHRTVRSGGEGDWKQPLLYLRAEDTL